MLPFYFQNGRPSACCTALEPLYIRAVHRLWIDTISAAMCAYLSLLLRGGHVALITYKCLKFLSHLKEEQTHILLRQFVQFEKESVRFYSEKGCILPRLILESMRAVALAITVYQSRDSLDLPCIKRHLKMRCATAYIAINNTEGQTWKCAGSKGWHMLNHPRNSLFKNNHGFTPSFHYMSKALSSSTVLLRSFICKQDKPS